MKRVYIIAASLTVIIILIFTFFTFFTFFTTTTSASESYIDAPFNLMVVDGNGNMSPITIRPPSLDGIPTTSNIIYVDDSGNIGTISVEDVYTSYQGNPSTNKVRNLLTIDSNNNFSTLSTLNFNPCYVNGDPVANPNSPNGGTPQKDGTCACRNNWVGNEKGKGCAICDRDSRYDPLYPDRYPAKNGITHVGDGVFGNFAGPNCEFKRNTGRCSSSLVSADANGIIKCDKPTTPPPITTPPVTRAPANTPSPVNPYGYGP
jgi:hypothetical protein